MAIQFWGRLAGRKDEYCTMLGHTGCNNSTQTVHNEYWLRQLRAILENNNFWDILYKKIIVCKFQSPNMGELVAKRLSKAAQSLPKILGIY